MGGSLPVAVTGGMFSLENSEGLRFLIRGRVFTDPEIAALHAAGKI